MSLVGPLPLPAGTQARRVEIPGGALTVLDHPAGGGVPVVLVPGFTGSKEDFRLVLAPLADAGRRTLAVDQRGQYESAGPDHPAAYTVDALAADLLALLDALGTGPVHLVGHSFGGLVARAAVLARPQAARSLTLMCSGPAALTGPRVELLPLMAPILEQGGMPALVDAVEALGVDDPRTLVLSEQERDFLRVRMLASSPVGLVGMAEALTGEPDLVAELRATGVPVLVLHGAGDDAWSPAVQADMAARLGARYVVVPDAMHSPAVENPTCTAAALTAFAADVEAGVG